MSNRSVLQPARFAAFTAGFAVAVGVLVLVGWAIDSASLKSVAPGLPTMKGNSALCFVLLGLGLWGNARKTQVASWLYSASSVGVAFATIIVSLTLLEYALNTNLGIDELVFDDVRAPGGSPGRMAVISAIILFSLAIALLLNSFRRAGALARICAGLAFIVSELCCVSYIYSRASLDSIPLFSSVAVHTAFTALILSMGVMAIIPNQDFFNLFFSKRAGGVLMRRLLPAVTMIPVMAGLAGLAGARAGWYSQEFELALFIMISVSALTGFVYWAAIKATHAEHVLEVADRNLRQNDERFRILTESLPHMFWMQRPDQTLIFLSKTASDFTGLSLEEVLRSGWGNLVHQDDLAGIFAQLPSIMARGEPHEAEFRFRHHSGEYRWVVSRAIPLKDDKGAVIQWVGSTEDIHDKKLAKEHSLKLYAEMESQVIERTAALKLSEERFRGAFDYAPIGFALVSPAGRWMQVNRSLCDIVGYTEAELLATDFQAITHPDDLDIDLDYVRQMLNGSIQSYQMEKRYFHKQGHVVSILLAVSLVRNESGVPLYFVSQIEDITQRKQSEEKLNSSLQEKEVMLREIHHRVKNNLQIVSTLLDLQSEHMEDPRALKMLQESRGRIKSMSLIHERLYRSGDMTRVDFAEYVRQLADDVYQSYRMGMQEVDFELMADLPPLPIDIAIPCGLLLNELISNCFKHAFSKGGAGSIHVALSTEGDRYTLRVADNGIGFPVGIDFRHTTSFGMQLVIMLVEQLKGNIDMKVEDGTVFVIGFASSKK